MKHWYRTTGAKAVCFVLCILSLVMTVASIFTAVLMISAEVYTQPQGVLTESLNYELVRHNDYDIAYRSLSIYGSEHQTLLRDYAADKSNMRFRFSGIDSDTPITDNGYDADTKAKIYSFYFDASVYEGEVMDLYIIHDGNTAEADYILEVYIDSSMAVYDSFAFIRDAVTAAYALKYWIYAIALFSLGLCITTFVILMCASGRKKGSEAVHPGALTPIPIDILTAVTAFIVMFGILLIVDVFYTGEILMMVMLTVWTLICANLLLGLCMSIACRIKLRTLFSGTFIWWVLKLMFRILKAIGRGISKIFKAIFTLPAL